MPTNYEKGRRFEYRVRDRLRRMGYYVIRSAGSHTFADLVAIGDRGVALIQCKAAPPSKATLVDMYRTSRDVHEAYSFPGNVATYLAYPDGRTIVFVHLTGDSVLPPHLFEVVEFSY